MWLESLKLVNFRNYHQLNLDFNEKTTLVVGSNASGKTNLLEGIFLLSLGESFRAQKIEEMVRWGEEVGRVQAEVEVNGRERLELEVVLTRGEVQEKKVQKRRFLVKGVARRKSDFAGLFTAVVFRPEDLGIVTGSPSLRRTWLDQVLMRVDRDYSRSLFSYEQALRRRNKILDLIRDEGVSRMQLAFWDQLLIKHGNVMTEKRRELIDFLNQDRERQVTSMAGLKVDYLASTISEKRLAQYAKEEVLAGYTLVGPHKDDWLIFNFHRADCVDSESLKLQDSISNQQGGMRDLAIYGSRGEQRLAVLWLKLMELEFLTVKKAARPVLLLDDIFSELDQERLKQILTLLASQQTIITTTEIGLIPKEERQKMGIKRLAVVR